MDEWRRRDENLPTDIDKAREIEISDDIEVPPIIYCA